MKQVDSYVKRWYDALEKGKVFGTRCPKCGSVEFPPLPICNECGAHEMEWFEIDGAGEIIAIDDCTAPLWGPELGPVLSGIVRLKEGAVFQAFIAGVPAEERESLFDKLPLSAHVEIQQRDGFKYPCFRIDEKESE